MVPEVLYICPGLYEIRAEATVPGPNDTLTRIRAEVWYAEPDGWTAEVVQGDGWVDLRLLRNGVVCGIQRQTL